MRSAYIEQNSGAGGYLAPYQRITAAVTLTAVEDSGKGFLLDSAGGAYSITLPTATTAAEGANYKFWVEENTPTGAITIAAGSAIDFGKVNETEVKEGEKIAGPVREKVLLSGDNNLIRIIKVLPDESFARLKDILSTSTK